MSWQRIPRWWSNTNSSNVFRAGNPAALIRSPAPDAFRAETSRSRSAARQTSCDHPASRASKSRVIRVDSIRAVMSRENDAMTTNTGGEPTWPAPSGIFAGGNHKSHCA